MTDEVATGRDTLCGFMPVERMIMTSMTVLLRITTTAALFLLPSLAHAITETDSSPELLHTIPVQSATSWLWFDSNANIMRASADHTVRMYDIQDGNPVWTILHSSPVVDCTLIGDSVIVSLDREGTLKFSRIEDGSLIREYRQVLSGYDWQGAGGVSEYSPEYAPVFCIYPEDSLFVGNVVFDKLVFFDLDSNNEIGTIAADYTRIMALQPGILGCMGGNLDIYDVHTYNKQYSLEQINCLSSDFSTGCYVHPFNRWCGNLVSIDADHARVIAQNLDIPDNRRYISQPIVFSSDGSLFVMDSSSRGGGSIWVVETSTLRATSALSFSGHYIKHSCIDCEGNYLAFSLHPRGPSEDPHEIRIYELP